MAELATITEKTREKNDSDSTDGSDSLKEVFGDLVHVLKQQGLTHNEIVDICQQPGHTPNKQSVPVAIFAGKLSPSESLCKYLKENLSFSYKEISKLLNRNERSIWTSHQRAVSKMPEAFSDEKLKNSRLVPIAIFANRGLSVLENLILYLREQTKGTNYQIAKLLNKTPSMIYTIYNRAKTKLKASQSKSELAGALEPAQTSERKPASQTSKPVRRKRLNIRDYVK